LHELETWALSFQSFLSKLSFVHNVTLERMVAALVTGGEAGSAATVLQALEDVGHSPSKRHLLRILDGVFGQEPITDLARVHGANGTPLNPLVVDPLSNFLSTQRSTKTLIVSIVEVEGAVVVVASDRRGQRWWITLLDDGQESPSSWLSRLRGLVGKDIAVIPHGLIHDTLAGLPVIDGVTIVDWAHPPLAYEPPVAPRRKHPNPQHNHLDTLEAESIRIIRGAVAVSKNPAMLFSMGKDSMVMLTLARKAFWPEPVPFPLVMIDTRWKFREMYRFCHWIENQPDLNVIVHINPDAIRDDINPFDHGSAHHTDVAKTQALKQVLDTHHFDYVLGGARRDEEKSRAKERVFSVRSANHGWDPKNQRPELWNLYNTRLADGESMRVFPLSNWTELDVWRYIERESIPVVPLYFSKARPFVERNGSLIMVDDERFRLEPEEKVHFEPIRFRTLGCYPLTGGVRSEARTVADIIAELEESRVSERSSRVIDFDPGASMEQKKKEGYF
jgi:sulfate adenylyltransferase subunit 2